MMQWTRAILSGAGLMACVTAGTAEAEDADIEAFFKAVNVDAMVMQLAKEGREYAQELAVEMLPGQGSGGYSDAIDQLYDADRMGAYLRMSLTQYLDGKDVAAMTAFYGSELGQEIVMLELAAREAMQDPELEMAAGDVWTMLEPGSARAELIETLVEVNDLVELNVAGTLNASMAFYTGFAEAGGQQVEQDMLADVWSQEAEVRAETSEWVYAFSALAYQPMSDDELEAYVAFGRTEAGRQANLALFSGFDALYNLLSKGVGLAAGRALLAQDL